MIYKHSVLFIICLISGILGAWIISNYGYRFGFLDSPNERSSHFSIIPKGGGVGILAAFTVSSLTLGIPLGYWLPATVLSMVSFYGDKYEISPRLRLFIQFVAVMVFLLTARFSGLLYSPFLQVKSGFLLFIYPMIFFFFMVGTANFYNFMDGINGIAGITGIVGFSLIGYFAYRSGATSLMILSLGMVFSCLGFLPFNMPKAKVFMGDVGSILLGFVFAGMVVLLSKNIMDCICLIAFLFPFYADELTTMVVRIRDGSNLSIPHRKHIYQLLANEMGVSHWKISFAYGIFQICIGISMLFVRDFGINALLVLLFLFCAVFTLSSYAIRYKVSIKNGS